MRKLRAILHIGMEKTGSTSIQAMLASNRGRLLRQGFAFLRAPGERNQTGLALYAAQPALTRSLPSPIPGGAEQVMAKLPQLLAREIRGLPEHVHTVVFSNEHCHSRIKDKSEVLKLKQLLDNFFHDYKVIIYLRRQDEAAVSDYSTIVKGERGLKNNQIGILPRTKEEDGRLNSYYDYAHFVSMWRDIFGKESLSVRVFEKYFLVSGDVVSDFACVCGLDVAGFELGVVQNSSVKPAAQELLRLLGESAVKNVPQIRKRRALRLVKFLGAKYEGTGRLPARQEAMDFVHAFDASNECVRAEFFPERSKLFSEDFSRYPVEAEIVSDRDVLQAALDMILNMAEEMRRLHASVAVAEGRLQLLEQGDQLEAVRCYETALSYSPGFAAALKAMVELAERGGDCPPLLPYLKRARAAAPDRAALWDGLEARVRRMQPVAAQEVVAG